MPMQTQILARGPFSAGQLSITWEPGPRHLSPDVGNYVADRWDEYCGNARHNNRMLYNSPVAELRRQEVRDNQLEMTLAPTHYKNFLVSSMRDRAWFTTHAPEAISPALGNSILLTAGNRALLGVRSKAVAAYPGRAHLFGGVLHAPERTSRALDKDFVLLHLYQELQEEIELTPDHLAVPPRVLALVWDDFLGQPELIWHAPLKGAIEPLLGLLNTEEHDQFAMVDLSQPPATCGFCLTPVAELALELHQAMPAAENSVV